MRSLCRLFLALILFAAAAGDAAAQDANATPAPPLPVTAAFSAGPSEQSSLPPADATPSPTAVPSPTAAPAAKPLAPAVAAKSSEPPTQKKVSKVGKTESSKASPKPAETASSRPAESSDKAAAAAATASVDTNTGNTPPSAPRENPQTVAAPSVDPGTATNPTSSEVPADKNAVRAKNMGPGIWLLVGIALLGAIAVIAFVVGHNGRHEPISILDHDLSEGRSPLAHSRLS